MAQLRKQRRSEIGAPASADRWTCPQTFTVKLSTCLSVQRIRDSNPCTGLERAVS